MKVKDIMSSPVDTVSSDAVITEAAQKMKSSDIGILPVQQENNVIGMITDRDIVIRVIAERLDPQTTKIEQAMTHEATFCSEDDEAETAAKMMEDKQIHRLLVLDKNNNLAGILSVGDLACKSTDEHLTYETLERICEPSGSSS